MRIRPAAPASAEVGRPAPAAATPIAAIATESSRLLVRLVSFRPVSRERSRFLPTRSLGFGQHATSSGSPAAPSFGGAVGDHHCAGHGRATSRPREAYDSPCLGKPSRPARTPGSGNPTGTRPPRDYLSHNRKAGGFRSVRRDPRGPAAGVWEGASGGVVRGNPLAPWRLAVFPRKGRRRHGGGDPLGREPRAGATPHGPVDCQPLRRPPRLGSTPKPISQTVCQSPKPPPLPKPPKTRDST